VLALGLLLTTEADIVDEAADGPAHVESGRRVKREKITRTLAGDPLAEHVAVQVLQLIIDILEAIPKVLADVQRENVLTALTILLSLSPDLKLPGSFRDV